MMNTPAFRGLASLRLSPIDFFIPILAVVLLTAVGPALAEGEPESKTDTPMASPSSGTTLELRGETSEGEPSAPQSSTYWPATGFWSTRPGLGLPESAPMRVLEPEPPPLETPPEPVVSEAPVRIPLPPRRPREFASPSRLGPLPGLAPREMASASGDCYSQLSAYGAGFAPSGQPPTRTMACSIESPIRLASIARPGGGAISLPDRPLVACRLAVRFVEWVRATAPVLDASHGAPLVSITTGPGWDCRTRNRRPGAKLSAHGNGLALDVNHWLFANRARLTVTGSGGKAVFRTVRQAACTWFSTILGPGSDGYHEDHLHVDVLSHGRGGGVLCR